MHLAQAFGRVDRAMADRVQYQSGALSREVGEIDARSWEHGCRLLVAR